MKKIINLLFLLFLLHTGMTNLMAQNMIVNGNFETFNETSCCATSPAYCDPGVNIAWRAFYAGCTSGTGWYSSHGTADMVWEYYTCAHQGIVGLCKNHYPEIGAGQGETEGIYFDNNLTLSPNTIYTLTLTIWAEFQGESYEGTGIAYIKLANGLVNGNAPLTVPSVQNQTIYSNNDLKFNRQSITIDFVPNDTYHQLWFYLEGAGWFNIDNVDLRVKGTYAGPEIITATCCGDPVTYSNTVLPASILNKESITTGTAVTASSTVNTTMQAGMYMRFSPGTTLTASASNAVYASIVSCKPKPFTDGEYGAGANVAIADCYEYPYNFIGGNQLQKGVNYTWSSSPSSGSQYLGNLSMQKTQIFPVLPVGSITYTLTASNNCGSRSSSMVLTYSGSCPSGVCPTCRTGDTDNELISDSDLIQYYPNPSGGSFTLSLQFVNNQATSCTIYNSMGQQVYTRSFGDLMSLNESIDLNVQNGLYTIKIKHGEKEYQQKILISK